MKKIYLLGLFLLGLWPSVQAQNLEEIGIKKGIKTSGSVNLNAIYYTASGIPIRRDPFNWFVTGNLNLTLFGYSAPFSFSYSNLQKSFSQPFNQLSFSPQYKWVKTYLGYSSMTFSPYTLAGHVFLGAGVEVSPGNWRVAAMYGRLKKATPFNLQDTTQNYNAAYQRMGYGVKVGYEQNGNEVSLNVFTAKDDETSLPFVLAESQLTAQQNVAASLKFRKTILKKLFIEGEYGFSSLNKDIRANHETQPDSLATPDSLKTTIQSHNLLKGLLPENNTQRYFDAFNGSLGYQGNWYAIQLKYERVAPEYETLGAYFFNNDMENITVAPTVRLFKNMLTVAANVGVQRNNLNNERASTTNRWVGSGNLNYTPNEHWNLTGSYSNFSTYTNVRPQADPFFRDPVDTLNFYQISQSYNGSASYMFGNKDHRHTVMGTGSYQHANNQASYLNADNASFFYTGTVAYNYTQTPKNLTLGGSFNYYTTQAGEVASNYWGPSAQATKAFLDKTLRVSLASSYNYTTAAQASSDVWNTRMSIAYSPKENPAQKTLGKHNLLLGINFLKRLTATDAQPSFSEWTNTLGYTYSF